VLLYKDPGFQGDWAITCERGEYDPGLKKCVTPPTCEAGEFDEASGKCRFKRYRFVGDEFIWGDAKNNCESLGAHLATIMSEAESSMIASFGPYVWMGLNDIGREGIFVWVTEEPVTYANWDVRQPDNYKDEDCCHTQSGGVWNDLTCTGRTIPSVCEWDWEFGAVGLCPEGYEYQEEGDFVYCYGFLQCPEGYILDPSTGECQGEPN